MTTADTAIQRSRPSYLIPGYRLVTMVGKGGMGEVHQAVQLSLGRTVAVKLLAPELAKDDQFVARFEKEGAALAALRHPNIVSIVDRGKSDDTYYLVMEFVDGQSLRERMRDPAFDAMSALRTLAQIARAIDYAHGRGIVHRDLKPENILFDEQAGDIPKVTDFGLAGFDDRLGHEGKNLTQTNMAMGTASYMAPEQRVDAKTAGPRADLYSLGVMMYEMLTGELPVGSFSSVSQRKPQLDKRLDAIVAKCLKPAPEDRYPTVSAFLQELEALVPVTSPPSAAKTTALQRLGRKVRSVAKRVGFTVGALLVVFAVAIIATSFLRSQAETKKVPPGVELMTDFGERLPLSSAARLDKERHVLTLGEGPDTVSLQALGRVSRLEKGVVHYDVASEDPSGRTVIDAQVPGDGLRFTARVDTEARPPSKLEPLLAVLRGPRPDARSALMLIGQQGRYVALVVSGSGAEPVLEWSLGPDKRGTMLAPLPTKAKEQALQLRIEPATGELYAEVGSGRDLRILADGLRLGPQWLALFGETPRAAVGCLEGTCAFHDLRVEGLVVPRPAPPPEPPVSPPPLTSAKQPGKQPAVAAKAPPPPPPPVRKEPPKKNPPPPPPKRR